MKLSKLHEATPLTMAIQSGIGKNYFAVNRAALIQPAASKSLGMGNSSYGLGGGNYGAQMGPRLQSYFGGMFGK